VTQDPGENSRETDSKRSDDVLHDAVALDYAWKWFDLHAKQRQTNIQFSIALLSAILAASGYLLVAKSALLPMVASIFGFLASIVFYGIDARNSFLVKLAEKNLKDFEENYKKFGRKIEIVGAADNEKYFMIKYSLAAKLIYFGYAVIFIIFLFVSICNLFIL
jgi:hypothetical protein